MDYMTPKENFSPTTTMPLPVPADIKGAGQRRNVRIVRAGKKGQYREGDKRVFRESASACVGSKQATLGGKLTPRTTAYRTHSRSSSAREQRRRGFPINYK